METINKNEYLIIIFFLMRSFILGLSLKSIYIIANQDAWISILVASILGLIPLIIYYQLLNHDSKLNINGLIDKYFNKFFAFIFKLLLIMFFIFHISIILWSITNFVTSQYLYRTPLFAILTALIIPVFYIVNKKLAIIGRISIIFIMIVIVLFTFSFLFLLGDINLHNSLPIFEYGATPILSASINSISYTILPVFAILIIPKDNIKNNKKLFSSIIKVYIISYIAIFIIVFMIINIFGINLTLFYEFPEYNVLKLINIGNFIQRVESIFSFQWFFDITIANVLFIYYIKNTIKETYKLNKKWDKYITFLISTIVVILARNIFENNTIASIFIKNIYKYIVIFFLLIIPTIILLTCKIRKNKV